MHESNHYHALVLELQKARRQGVVMDILFLEHDVAVLMSSNASPSDVQQIAEHLSEKYRLYVEVVPRSKKIIIYDAYCLDPRV